MAWRIGAANPGSADAINAGCCCPVIDNGYGAGYMGQEGVFAMVVGCPEHDLDPDDPQAEQG